MLKQLATVLLELEITQLQNIHKMTKNEAKQLMTKHLLPFIEKQGYKERKGSNTDFEFIRKTAKGQDIIIGGFTDYHPAQQIIYSLSKKNKIVHEILLKLQDSGISLSPKVSNHTALIGVSYSSINNLNSLAYLPYMESEVDVVKCVSMMIDFMEVIAFPIMEKFEDLREVDKIINGSNPWATDWKMPYSFGAYFNFCRLIIARLSGNPHYFSLIEFTNTTLEKRSAESCSQFIYSKEDLSKPLPALIKLLEDVKPIY